MLGAVVAACTNKEIVEPQQGEAEKVVYFTATLAPKGEGSSRAITSDTDENGKEILNVKWKKDEKIAICYTKTDGTPTKVTATVGKPNADGSATFTATLTDVADGTQAKFIYPFSMATDGGGINMTDFCSQNGELTEGVNSISKRHDLATGTGIISVSNEGTATVSGKVGMKNEVCICKFNLTLENPNASANYYDISIAFEGGDTYSLSMIPKERLGSLYVAMLPVTKVKTTITAKGYASNESVSGTSPSPISVHRATISSVKLDPGKFYRNVPVTLAEGRVIDLRNGSIEAQDCDIITSKGEETSNTITIVPGVTVKLRDVNIKSAGIICEGEGNATIILEGTNIIDNSNFANQPAIQTGLMGTLTILGSGSLTATGGENAAGIGSGMHCFYCNITITGGTITATGGIYAAGIGSGHSGHCDAITIRGGTVTAYGGANAAGIGFGYGGSCGDITITGGTITAYKGEGTPYSIGLGVGESITIDGTNYGNQGIETNPFVYP